MAPAVTGIPRCCNRFATNGRGAAGWRCATTCPIAGAGPRVRRPGSAATDRAGIVEAIDVCRGLAEGPLIAGGHSYGGRQTSMVVAAREALH